MKYVVRASDGATQTLDEEAALQHFEQSPNGAIARFGTNQWVTGKSFLEFGDLAFESKNQLIPVPCLDENRSAMILTTEAFPPYEIGARLGIVGAERVQGLGVLKEFFASVSDVTGARSRSIERELSVARTQVTTELRAQARNLGAHGVIGISYSYTEIGGKDSMMLLVAGWGTAVVFT
jgi:uncharacterized protein YbjQ (UPF0145 family)